MNTPAIDSAEPAHKRRRQRLWDIIAVVFLVLVISASLKVAYLLMAHPDRSVCCGANAAKIHSLETALVSYKIETNWYPTTEQGLLALVVKPTTVMPQKPFHQLIPPELMIDSWNHEFQYRIPGIHNPDGYDVWSLGPDGVNGTEDDIGNW